MLSIITLPQFTGTDTTTEYLISATTTALGGELLADLLPIAGALMVITIVGLVLHAIVKRTLGALSRIGAGKGKRRRR